MSLFQYDLHKECNANANSMHMHRFFNPNLSVFYPKLEISLLYEFPNVFVLLVFSNTGRHRF